MLSSQQEQESGNLKEMWNEEIRKRKIESVQKMIAQCIGSHYLNEFNEDKIRQKDELDGYIEDIYRGKGLIITGGVGVGKTMDLVYIVKKLAAHANFNSDTVGYYFMPDLFNLLHFGKGTKLAKNVILDDWGREYAEPFALSRFEIFIEELYAREIPVIATTNLKIKEFIGREGWERITDRMRETCNVLKIRGKSMRHR